MVFKRGVFKRGVFKLSTVPSTAGRRVSAYAKAKRYRMSPVDRFVLDHFEALRMLYDYLRGKLEGYLQ